MKYLSLMILLISFGAIGACEEHIKITEKTKDPIQQRELALKTIELCKTEKFITINPQIALSVLDYKEGKFQESLKWAEEANRILPNVALPYLNISAAKHSMKQYDGAIEAAKKGLSLKWIWVDQLKAELNANLGLSVFSKAAFSEKTDEIMESEKYFLESVRLDPKLAQNYFYLGTLANTIKNDYKAAIEYFTKGCELKDQRSCKGLQGAIEAQKAAATAPAPQAAPSTPVSGNEGELYERLAKNYMKKGIPEKQARETVETLKKNLASIPAEQRLMSLGSMVKATE